MEKLFRLSPFPVLGNFTGAAIAYNLAGQYEKSAEVSSKAIQRFPPNYLVYVQYSISTSLLGRTEEARASVNELLRLNPQFSIEQFKAFMSRIGMKDQTAVEKFVEALRKAGLPETTAKG
jgi:tetratricopeptide (TPR) repeat protein